MTKTIFVNDDTVMVGSHAYSLVNEEGLFTADQLRAVLLARAQRWILELGDE